MSALPKTYRRVVLARRPPAEPAEADFRVEEAPMPEPGPREVLVRVVYLSLDPYMRGRMRDAASYAAPVGIGEVMTGGTVGEVVKSNHPGFKVGDIVEDRLGWQEYAIGPARRMRKVDAVAGADLDRQRRARHAGHDGLFRPARRRPAEGRRDRGGVGRFRRGRPGGRAARQDRGLPRGRHRRRRQEVRLREGRARLRRLHRLQGREGPRRGASRRPAPTASTSTSTMSAAW